VSAHHSFAMFDQAHPVELTGTVSEFRFTSPHVMILLEVSRDGERPAVWVLEGNSPNSLRWDGWSHTALKRGDRLRITVEPLRSGAAGGRWNASMATFTDGSPIGVAIGP